MCAVMVDMPESLCYARVSSDAVVVDNDDGRSVLEMLSSKGTYKGVICRSWGLRGRVEVVRM